VLRSYVSPFLASRLLTGAGPLREPVARDGQAAVLFADIAGFTPLAERLALKPHGTEQLSGLLDRCFGTLTALVASHGGEVVTFAGDALIAAWDASDCSRDATAWAMRCAQAIQCLPLLTGIAGPTPLLRMGIGVGPVTAVRAGGLGGQWQLLLCGPALAQVGHAVGLAPAGQVVVSPAARRAAGGACSGELLTGGHLRLTAVAPPDSPAAAVDAAAPVLLEHVRACVPLPVQAHVAGGHQDWLAELRQISTVFIGLTDAPRAGEDALALVQPLVAAVQAVLLQREGTLQRVLTDDKGVVLVTAFGPPPQGHRDDPVRAVHAARAVAAAFPRRDQPLSIGVTTGRAFCGPVGSDRHREYVLLGDAVNLAARLMQAAPGAVLCDEGTYRHARARVPFERLRDLTLKGKSAPQRVYAPRAATAAARFTPAAEVGLVGRAFELGRLEEHLVRLQQGVGGIVELVGEAGMGKSRTISEFVRRAAGRGVRALVAAGDAIDKGTPYHAWRAVFAEIFGLTGLPDAQRRQVLSARLQQLPQLADRAPLLDRVLSVQLPDTKTTGQMTGQARADSTVELLVHVLLHGPDGTSASEPVVLVLDDAHWVDSASSAVARRAVADRSPVLLVVARRPEDGPARDLLPPGTHVDRLLLQAMAPSEATALIARLLPAGTPAGTLHSLMERAQGVPFFLEELAYAAADPGPDGRPAGAPARATPRAPDNSSSIPYGVQGVVGERLDRLAPALQLVLKVASVIGRTFAEQTLAAIHPLRIAPAVLGAALAELQRQAFVVRDEAAIERTYRFRHALTQEVTYDRILESQRRSLHRGVACWYEQEWPADMPAAHGLLAYHWRRAGDATRAIHYLELAGQQWLSEGACEEAVGALEAALRLTDEATESVAAERRARWHRQLGDAYMGLGDLPSSRTHASQALALLGREASAGGQPRAARQLAGQLVQQAWHRLRRPAVAAGSTAAVLEAARANERLALLEYYGNAKLASITRALRVVNLAEQVPASAELARGYAAVGLGAGMVGLHPIARSYVQSGRDIARAGNDLPALAFVLLAAGAYETSLGQWQSARAALGEALEIAEGLGDLRRWGELAALWSQVLHHEGQFTEMAEWMPRMQDMAQRSGDPQHMAHVLLAEVCLLLPRGRPQRAADLAAQAVDLLAGAGASADEILVWGLSATAQLRCGGATQARKAAARAMHLAAQSPPVAVHAVEGYAGVAETLLALQEAGDRGLRAPAWQACHSLQRFARSFPVARPRALLCKGWAQILCERPAVGLRTLQGSRHAALQLHMPYEAALATREMGRHLAMGSQRRHDHLDQALQVFARLGATHDKRRTEELLASG
jgi:class 3 adenylate cyclase